MTLREKIEVLQAFGQGKEIEYRPMSCMAWRDVLKNSEESEFNFIDNDYRIKPKPKQTVTIEKWLVLGTYGEYMVFEIDNIKVMERNGWAKVKLLDTYEVEV